MAHKTALIKPKLPTPKLNTASLIPIVMRVVVVSAWFAALGLIKTQGPIPIIYFLPLLSLMSVFLLDLFGGIICITLTSGLLLLSPAVTSEAQVALIGLLWVSTLLIVMFRQNPALDPPATREKLSHTPAPPADLNPTVTSMAVHLTHELRTPINLIIGFSEAMLHPLNPAREPFPAVYRDDVETIQRNARVLQNKLEEWVSGTALQPQLISAKPQTIAPGEVIHEAAALFRERFEDMVPEVEIQILGKLPLLHLNRTFFRQMLLSLMQKVAQAAPHQPLAVSAHSQDRALIIRTSTLSSRDQNPADTLTTEEAAGLAFCTQFVSAAQGKLWATGVGKARSYYVSLPSIEALNANAAEAAQPMIICDSNPKVIAFFAQHLPGWQVVGISNRAELAGLQLEGSPCAVVITGEDGCLTPDELIRHFGTAVPLITCAVASVERLLRSYSRLEHLVKPVTREALDAALKRLTITPANVLVLDDNHDIVQMFSQMIGSLVPQARLWKAYSGQEGLALLTEQQVDLLIVDLKLPDISGLELIPQIRALPRYQTVPILLISGISEDDIVHQPVNSSLSVYQPGGSAPEAWVRRIAALVSAYEDSPLSPLPRLLP